MVLQSCFAVVYGLTRYMDKVESGIIINACVILHNMIGVDEHDSYDVAYNYDQYGAYTPGRNVR